MHFFDLFYCVFFCLFSRVLHHFFSVLLSWTLKWIHSPPLASNPLRAHFFQSFYPTVLPYYCPSILLSFYPTVLPSCCPSILLSFHPTVLLSYCPSILLSFYLTVFLSYCSSILLSFHPTVLLSYCSFDPVVFLISLFLTLFFFSLPFSLLWGPSGWRHWRYEETARCQPKHYSIQIEDRTFFKWRMHFRNIRTGKIILFLN